MPEILHHVPDTLLAAYASGALDNAFSLVVASHVSLCAECRAGLGSHETVGGAILDELPAQALSSGLKERVLGQLDLALDAAPLYRRQGIFPGPVARALGGRPPRWQTLGLGARQCILESDDDGSVRLLQIPPGRAVPEHGHVGLELTLVLQGSFHDDNGAFGVGDLEVADAGMDHSPVAGESLPCVCLAATSAPLRFKGLFPRLLQPILRI